MQNPNPLRFQISTPSSKSELTQEEWNEISMLKDAITYAPSTVHPDRMERFSELMVKSLQGKGENVHHVNPTNF